MKFHPCFEDLKFSHPTLKELELNTIVLRPYDVILMLQNLTLHFSERTYEKYPVSVLTSSRTFMIMILEEEMLEPAIDRLVEITTYVVIIFSVIFLGGSHIVCLISPEGISERIMLA